ncbi:PQQ-binding-like beta-propeller repeat protein [Maioricimonas sp. JC845]|uniref:outer membrane protein assembly factor BamB family protein n=1 Tax=Maioricimonas sp. JC845 TaxID=3232138 RepID=UPI00345AC6E7
MTDLAVIPILPTLHSLLLAVPVGIVALLVLLRRLAQPGTAKRLLRLGWQVRGLLLTSAAIAVLVGVAAVAGLRVFPAARFAARTDSPTEAVPWEPGNAPTARGDLKRAGTSGSAAGPTGGGINWKAGGPTQNFYATPAIAGERLYCIASTDARRGRIECRSLRDGSLLWSSAPPGYRATFSSPVLSGRYLVCGEGLHDDRMARIVCIDTSPEHAGDVLWTFQTNSHVECTPVIDGDRVYAGAGDDGVYCLALDPDLPEEKRLIWHAGGRDLPDAETSLAVHQDRVYVGLGVGGEAVCVLDAATGTMLERVPMPYPVFGLPAIDRDRLYVGMGRGDYVHEAEDPAGQVCCIDLNRLTIQWTCPTPATVLGAVVIVEDELLFASADGTVHRLNRDGEVLGTWQCGEPILTSPAVTRDAVYVVSGEGRLYGLTRDLKPFWQVEIGGAGRCVSSPVAAGGQICFGTEAAGLISAGSPAPAVEPVWHGEVGGNAAFDRAEDMPPSRGRVQWSWPVDASLQNPDEEGSLHIAAPPGVIGTHVLLPVSKGTDAGLICLETSDDGTRRPRERWRHKDSLGVHISPAAIGNHVFMTSGQPDDSKRELKGLDRETGKVLWRHPVRRAASGRLFLSGSPSGSICVADLPDGISLLSTDGVLQWRARIGHVRHSVTMDSGRILAAVDDPPALILLDAPTGRTLWRVPLDTPPTTAPLLVEDQFLAGTQQGLQWRHLIDGQPIVPGAHFVGGNIRDTGITSLIRTGPVSVAGCTADGDVFVLDYATGVARVIPQPEEVRHMVRSGSHLLCVGGTGIQAVPLAAGISPGDRLPLWCDLRDVGVPAATGVWNGNVLLLPVEGRGLVGIGE